MQTITITRSGTANRVFLAVNLLVVSLTVATSFQVLYLFLILATFTLASVHFWQHTFGLGREGRLSYRFGWEIACNDAPNEAVTAIKAGWVTPGLICATLHTQKGRYNLLLPKDAADPQGHWHVRRLAVEGIRLKVPH